MARSISSWIAAAMIFALSATGSAAPIETPRDLLVQASFVDRDRTVALQRINRAAQTAGAAMLRTPGDREATIINAMALGYRAKLTGNRSEAIAARKRFEALVARDPRNPEAQAALGAWHVGVIAKVGRLIGRAAVGAQKPLGLAALDRSVALGGNRAMFAGLAALLRLELDPADPQALALAETASRAPTPTAIDRQMQRAAATILMPLRAGDRPLTKRLAAELLPLGRLDS